VEYHLLYYCSDATTTLAPFKSRLIEEDEDEIPDHNHYPAVHHGQDDMLSSRKTKAVVYKKEKCGTSPARTNRPFF